MAYSDLTFDDLEQKFGIKNRIMRLFHQIKESEPSPQLIYALNLATELPTRTEKAKSEMIVIPILLEVRELTKKYFTIYSGDILNADKERGLIGECDFILSKDTGSFSINYPIIQIVEAKKNDIDEGIRQCAAQLLGAKIFNEKKGIKIKKIYGCATTGDDWQFLILENDEIIIDSKKYYLSNLNELLSIFIEIINFYKTELG